MTPHSIPVLVMAGLTCYAGIYHLLVYFRQRHRLLDLAFTLLCLFILLYDVFAVFLYNVQEPIDGLKWQRAMYIVVPFGVFAFLWFGMLYTKSKPGKVFYSFIVFFAVAALIQIFDRSSFTWLSTPLVTTITFPSGWQITYNEIKLGLFTHVESIASVIALIYIFWMCIDFYQKGNREQASPLIIALAIFFVAMINDISVTMGLYPFVYSIEYAFLGIILAMAFAMSSEVVKASIVEEELKISEARFRAITENTSQVTLILSKDREYCYISPAFESVLGYKPEEFLGKTIDTVIHPDDLSKLTKAISRVSSESGSTILVSGYKIRRKDGHLLYCEGLLTNMLDVPGIEGIVVNCRDITDRIQAESELRLTRFSVENATTPIFWMGVDANFFYVNKAACNTLGYTFDELISMSVHDLDPLFPKEVWSDHWKDIKEKKSFSFESQHRKKNGEVFPVYITVNYLEYEGKEYNLAMAVDISQLKKVEKELEGYRNHLEELVQERTKELKKAQSDLLKQERLATLGQLVAVVSHELRNPLGTINNSLSTIRERVQEGSTDVSRPINRAERNIARCVNIIEELLDVTRSGKSDFEPTEIDKWLWRIIEEQELPADVEIIMEINSGFTLNIDQERCRRCILNLLTNALQAIEEKKMQLQPDESVIDSITISASVNADNLEIKVIDTGVGMKEDEIAHVFDPLYSTKSFGVGLGLTIVREIMEEHDGSIVLESRCGVGTKATLKFPIQNPESQKG